MCQICCEKLRKAKAWSRKNIENCFKFAYVQKRLTRKANGKAYFQAKWKACIQIYLRNKININIDITTRV